jgi:hypothetical protein
MTDEFSLSSMILFDVTYDALNPPADGNCLPQSVCDLLGVHLSIYHTTEELRNLISAHIMSNWTLDDRLEHAIMNFFFDHSNWQLTSSDNLQQADVDRYTENIVRRNFAYLGSVEIICLSQMFNCKFCVISKNLHSNLPPYQVMIGEDLPSPQKTLTLYHTHIGTRANEHSNHYQALFPAPQSGGNGNLPVPIMSISD